MLLSVIRMIQAFRERRHNVAQLSQLSDRELALHRDPVLQCFSLSKLNHFLQGLVYIYPIQSGRRFLHHRTHSTDDGIDSVSVLNSSGERLCDLLQIRRVSIQEMQRRNDVVARRRNRLIDLMCNRGAEFPHCYEAVCVRQLHLLLAKLPLAAGDL